MTTAAEPQDITDNVALDISGMLDPRTREYQEAIRLTPATLAHYRTGGKWIPARHLLHASSVIAHEVSQGDARIIVEMPPRHGKSELDSVHVPVWFLDRWSHLNVILGTHGSELSTGFGRRVRDAFIEDDGQFLRAKVRDDVQRTDFWMTTAGGSMLSAGIGGPMVGHGGHLIIIDDYVKNFADAMSDTVSDSTWDWFRSVVYTRLEPGGSIIILATRWPSPKGDLIGRVLAQEPNQWLRIRFPAFAESHDVLGRVPGEPLWPERGYTAQRLQRIQSMLGEWLFASLYQQDPRDAEGIKVDVDQFRFVDNIEKPLELRWVRSWDIASTDRKKRKKSDFTSGSLLGTQGKPGSPFITTYFADLVRGQWAPSMVETQILTTAQSDGVGVPIVIEQEPGASGKAYAEHLATNILAGYNVTIQPSSGGNKIVKDQPYLAAVNHGRITLVRATWNDVHKAEVKDFPNAAHDDTVDSTAQGYNHLFTTAMLSPTWGRELGTTTKSQIIQPKTKKLVTGCVFGRTR